MTRQEIVQAAASTVEEMRAAYVPHLTGNMANNALKYREEGDEFIVYIDGLGKDSIAPYYPYTEFPWTDPRWHGKKNPNEGWVERFQEEFARRLAAKLGGKIKR